MDIREFEENLPKLVFVPLRSRLYFVETRELYNPEDDSSVICETIGDLLSEVIDGLTVEEIIGSADYSMLVDIDGGRGSSSSTANTFKFGHAPQGGSEDNGKKLFPASFNDGEKYQSEQKAIDKFREKHAASDHEYAIAIDGDGYVHQYIEGGRTSVMISGRNGQLIVHNHPSGGAFSDADLISVSQNPGERGIIASGTKGDYVFRKAKGFEATSFVKAVKNAKMKGNSYDDAVDRWLSKNQKKYGFKYQFVKK